MFDSLQETIDYYKSDSKDKHQVIYTNFHTNVAQGLPSINKVFEFSEGFGERAFCWLWHLLVKDMGTAFKFMEIGVFKGRVLAIVEALASGCGKSATMYGITPLSTTGDKYSGYDNVDYAAAILANFKTFEASAERTTIYKGLSNDTRIVGLAQGSGQYDIIYIDGCHDYEVVCQDIANYLPLVRTGGYLVMDDASLYLPNPYGQFLGHPDVSRAAKEKLDSNPAVEHLFAVGHNRVWRKL
jgi:hypothetical protein